MKTPHKHAEVIKAWADGAEIQVRGKLDIDKWTDVVGPIWNECCQYRIKPEPKPDVVRCGIIVDSSWGYSTEKLARQYEELRPAAGLLKLTFDGETGKLKSAEVV